MTISPLAANSSASQSNAAAASGSSSSPGASIGQQLLAALAQSEAQSGTTTDPLLSYVVALNSQSADTGAGNTTYNAQGLLSQVQGEMMMNDPLLSPAAPSDPGGNVGAGDPGANIAATVASNSALASVIQSDPGLAITLENNQIEQQFLSMLP